MKLLSAHSTRTLIAIAAVVTIGTTGVAVAAAKASPTIHGCYAKKGGDLRRVGSGTACKASEVAISWNQRGPRGLRGPKGDTGPAGSARAYAAVNSDATFVSGQSKNIVGVSDFGTGSYCVFLDPSIDVTTVVSIVSLNGGVGSKDTAIYTNAGGCTEGTTAGIFVTTTDLAGAAKAAGFYLMVP